MLFNRVNEVADDSAQDLWLVRTKPFQETFNPR